MTTPPLKTLILAVQNTQDDLLALTWARERLFLVISVFAVILGFKGGGVPGYCEGHGSKFFADDTWFFCVGRLSGCLGPNYVPGTSCLDVPSSRGSHSPTGSLHACRPLERPPKGRPCMMDRDATASYPDMADSSVVVS